jgi:hypothetical protein
MEEINYLKANLDQIAKILRDKVAEKSEVRKLN